MSSIGTGPSPASGQQFDIGVVRAASGTDTSSTTTTSASSDAAASTADGTGSTDTTTSVVATTSASAGDIPVDASRVAQIKRAVDDGTYPLIPTKVGDAMVAARYMLRKE